MVRCKLGAFVTARNGGEDEICTQKHKEFV